MKTLWIEDVDALNVGRVIVTKTGTKDCTVCYSCDEREDYENRLKADLVAMLRFLWNDIENLDTPICDYASSDCISKWQVHEIIQQKINAIKAESEK